MTTGGQGERISLASTQQHKHLGSIRIEINMKRVDMMCQVWRKSSEMFLDRAWTNSRVWIPQGSVMRLGR